MVGSELGDVEVVGSLGVHTRCVVVSKPHLGRAQVEVDHRRREVRLSIRMSKRGPKGVARALVVAARIEQRRLGLHEPRFACRVLAVVVALESDHEDDGDYGFDAAMAACVQLALPLRPAAPSRRELPLDSPLLVTAFGMQLLAAVTADGRDRSRLERLYRYLS